MLDLILKALLVYAAFGTVNLLILLGFYNMRHTLYFTKKGSAKINDQEYSLFKKDPLIQRIYTTVVTIVIWPYLVTLMVLPGKKQ